MRTIIQVWIELSSVTSANNITVPQAVVNLPYPDGKTAWWIMWLGGCTVYRITLELNIPWRLGFWLKFRLFLLGKRVLQRIHWPHRDSPGDGRFHGKTMQGWLSLRTHYTHGRANLSQWRIGPPPGKRHGSAPVFASSLRNHLDIPLIFHPTTNIRGGSSSFTTTLIWRKSIVYLVNLPLVSSSGSFLETVPFRIACLIWSVDKFLRKRSSVACWVKPNRSSDICFLILS